MEFWAPAAPGRLRVAREVLPAVDVDRIVTERRARLVLHQIVIVAGPSRELDLALDALDALRGSLRVFSRPSDAAKLLLSPSLLAPEMSIGVVLIEVVDPAPGVAGLVAGLRREPSTARIPIVLWGPAEAMRGLTHECESWVNSCVRTVLDPGASATLLAQTIHYWAVVNRPPSSPSSSQDIGGRA